MINRSNFNAVQQYLDDERYLERDEKSIKRTWGHLRHMLEWLDETPLSLAPSTAISFPQYLSTARNDNKAAKLAPSTMQKACTEVRRFFNVLRIKYPREYRGITEVWCRTIKPSKSNRPQSKLVEHEYYTLEEVRQLLRFEPATLEERRDRGAVALIFLSAMRAGAFVSSPNRCINVADLSALQTPEEGVATKNSKAARTYMLNIPDLLEIVQDWDAYVRAELGPDGLWFPPLNTDGTSWSKREKMGCVEARRQSLAKALQRLCNHAGISYKSPHKLRNGHAVYVIKNAVSMEDLKAASQNMMHENFAIFWELYSKLSFEDVRKVIINLGQRNGGEVKDPDYQANLVAQTIQMIIEDPGLLKRLQGK